LCGFQSHGNGCPGGVAAARERSVPFISLERLGRGMGVTIELDDELAERIDSHLEDDETYEEFVEELLNIYESSRFVREGYS
jgi:hypothetical protein